MFGSEGRSEGATVRLTLRLDAPGVQAFVIDRHFRRREPVMGQTMWDLEPGLYKIKYKAGSTIEEQHVALEAGQPAATVYPPRLSFRSPAPLLCTGAPYAHQRAARAESRQTHVRLGHGSELFVFVRASDQPFDPASGLTLHDPSGRLLLDYDVSGARSAHEGWTASNAALDPGRYLLRTRTPGGGTFEQAIALCGGWQTHVLLAPTRFPHARGPRADLTRAAMMMTRPGEGFEPERPDLRWAELTRQALSQRRLVLTIAQVERMLDQRIENPMLDLYAAHLLLVAPSPDRRLVEAIVRKLQRLVGAHPDVAALEVWLGEAGDARFDLPPTLRSSWDLVVRATAQRPALVPAQSLAASIACSVWARGMWIVWWRPEAETALRRAGAAIARLRTAIASRFGRGPGRLPHLVAHDGNRTAGEAPIADAGDLAIGLQESVLDYVVQDAIRRSGLRPVEAEVLRYLTDRRLRAGQAARPEQIVDALGLPYAVIEAAATSLVAKLTSG